MTAVEGGTEVHGSLIEADRVDFCVTILEEGNYTISAEVKAPGLSSNSMYWTIDRSPDSGMVWHMNVSNQFGKQFVSDGGSPEGGNSRKEIYLQPGDMTISFYHREPGVALDKFELTKLQQAENGLSLIHI